MEANEEEPIITVKTIDKVKVKINKPEQLKWIDNKRDKDPNYIKALTEPAPEHLLQHYYQGYIYKQSESEKRALDALVDYELTMQALYDYPEYMGRPSRVHANGHKMKDFALRYGTCIEDMRKQQKNVDREIEIRKRRK
jgi:hypothetical protein